ncbi:MAG TPA: hypothetical protein VGK19_07280 [Capsulimonadaceae bacterium]
MDRMEAEFPAKDVSTHTKTQSLTVRQFLQETSADVIARPPHDTYAAVPDEWVADGPRRGGWLIDVWQRARSWVPKDGLMAYAGLIVVGCLVAAVLTFGDGAPNRKTPAPVLSSSVPPLLVPASIDGWTRWSEATRSYDPGDGHWVGTATYSKGSSTAEVWVQWPKTGNVDPWKAFMSASPVVQHRKANQPITAIERIIGDRTCRVWTIPSDSKTRPIASSWLPSTQPCSVTWQVGPYIVTTAGSEKAAMLLARAMTTSSGLAAKAVVATAK